MVRGRFRADPGAWRRFAAIEALGSLMMLAGNVGEFWVFSGVSYGSVARNAAWTTFLLGTLAALVGLAALAVRLLVVRRRGGSGVPTATSTQGR